MDWAVFNGRSKQLIARNLWIYSLLANLDSPLHRDTAAEIGRLYRIIAKIVHRIMCDSGGYADGGGGGEVGGAGVKLCVSDDLVLSYDVVLIIIGKHFKQAPYEADS